MISSEGMGFDGLDDLGKSRKGILKKFAPPKPSFGKSRKRMLPSVEPPAFGRRLPEAIYVPPSISLPMNGLGEDYSMFGLGDANTKMFGAWATAIAFLGGSALVYGLIKAKEGISLSNVGAGALAAGLATTGIIKALDAKGGNY